METVDAEVTTVTHGADPTNPKNRPSDERRRLLPWHFALFGIMILLAGVIAYIGFRRHTQNDTTIDIRPSNIPANVSTATASLMGLSPVTHSIAPDFRLTDQRGQVYSLSAFRNDAVVLEFMDPHCTDICPIVSQEFVAAYHDLGRSAKHVVFAAVNVNRYHTSVAAMARFSQEHGLDAIPSWHFFTGPVKTLERIWERYGIQVYAPGPNADVQHSSIVYFIGPKGIERFVASPAVDHTKAGKSYLPAPDLLGWGRGIAQVAQDVLHN